jgi:lycopene cyclase-like protein
MVGTLLRRAPAFAQAIADALQRPDADALSLAKDSWLALWPLELQRKHALYRFGLEKLMRYPEAQLRQFFATFFTLPREQWYGFLSNTLPLPQLIGAMVRLFVVSPWDVRWGLMQQQGRELELLLRLLRP